MIELKHTPGPWFAANPFGKFEVAVLNSEWTVYADQEANEDAAGDAHLIAAAPDMLDALDRVANLNPDAGEIGEGMLKTIVSEARAAIAKAKGESHE